jgi:hypothetical protein
MGLKVQVWLMSIGMPGDGAREGACIAAVVAVVGDMSGGMRMVCTGEQDMLSVWVRSEWGGHLEARWNASFARWLRSRRRAALNQPLKSTSLGLSMPDSAILS